MVRKNCCFESLEFKLFTIFIVFVKMGAHTTKSSKPLFPYENITNYFKPLLFFCQRSKRIVLSFENFGN